MKLLKIALASLLLIASGVAYSAQQCAIGQIVEVTEGWGDKEHLQIKMDYSSPGSQPPAGTKVLLPDELDGDTTHWLKFNADNVSEARLKRIRALAYLALANRNTVKLVSRWNGNYSCLNLSQIVIIANDGAEANW